MVLGSDYPFVMGEPEPVASVAALTGLDARDRDLILRDNVEGILAGIRR